MTSLTLAAVRGFLVTALFISLGTGAALAAGNENIAEFRTAKRLAAQIHEKHPVTIYCPCEFHGKMVDLNSCGYKVHKDAKRAARLEWEHVVPAENFGRSFPEWRTGAPHCVKKGKPFKGRKCASTNAEFSRMEADLYNLWPSIGELNGLRSNFNPTEFGKMSPELAISFGECKTRIADRKFEPMTDKGVIARTYMYMDGAYPGHGIISEKNQKLFAAWDKLYPVSEWECLRAKKIEQVQGNANPVLAERCGE